MKRVFSRRWDTALAGLLILGLMPVAPAQGAEESTDSSDPAVAVQAAAKDYEKCVRDAKDEALAAGTALNTRSAAQGVLNVCQEEAMATVATLPDGYRTSVSSDLEELAIDFLME